MRGSVGRGLASTRQTPLRYSRRLTKTSRRRRGTLIQKAAAQRRGRMAGRPARRELGGSVVRGFHSARIGQIMRGHLDRSVCRRLQQSAMHGIHSRPRGRLLDRLRHRGLRGMLHRLLPCRLMHFRLRRFRRRHHCRHRRHRERLMHRGRWRCHRSSTSRTGPAHTGELHRHGKRSLTGGALKMNDVLAHVSAGSWRTGIIDPPLWKSGET